MFVNYSLQDIKNGNISLIEENHREELKLIIKSFEQEEVEVNGWTLFEIGEVPDHRAYGFQNDDQLFYMKVVKENKEVIPSYFKNYNVDQISLFEGSSIEEAVRLYENYWPERPRRISEEEMRLLD